MKKFIKILLISILLMPINTFALIKKETVYSNLDYYGKVDNTIVTNHIYNEELGDLEDETELTDIININGKENFKLDENKITWQLEGKDIFYRGKTNKVLPIETEINYYLNDKKIKVEDLVGKEGNVKIVFKFKNNISNLVQINGNFETLYTPFVVTIGTIIDENSSNISISNGKVVNTGTKNMVVGLSSPGLYESMNIESLKNLDEITLSYYTTNFKLNNIYIVATPKILDQADLNIFDKMDELSSNVYNLKNNMDLIESSTKDLESGISSLGEGSNTITTNLKNVLDSLELLQNGSIDLDNGLKLALNKLELAKSSLTEEDLEGSLSNLLQLKNANISAIEKLKQANSTIESIYTNYMLDKVTEVDVTDQNLLTVKKTYESNLSLITLLEKNNEAIDKTISSLTDISLKIDTLITELSNGLNELKQGSSKISNGLTELTSGVEKLHNGMNELNDGVIKLNDGTKKLSDGISEFNSKGIRNLYNYSIRINSYSNKAESLINLANNYKGYSSNNSDNTLFISMVKSTH